MAYLFIFSTKKFIPKTHEEFTYSYTAQVYVFTRLPDLLKTINWIITAESGKKKLNRSQYTRNKITLSKISPVMLTGFS